MKVLHSVALKNHIDNFCKKNPEKVFKDRATGISIAKFKNTPDIGLSSFISIGLSGHILIQNSGLDIRQELLVTVDSFFSNLAVEKVIFSVAKLMIDHHAAVMRGQIIGPMGLLFPDDDRVQLTAVVCSYPAFFPDDFSFFENDGVTVFVELIPVLDNESDFLKKKGWSKFFRDVDEGKVDILNYYR